MAMAMAVVARCDALCAVAGGDSQRLAVRLRRPRGRLGARTLIEDSARNAKLGSAQLATG